jgi:hypothetical protein
LTCEDAVVAWDGFWLRHHDRDGRSDQVEGAGLDRGRGGQLLGLMPGEMDDLPVQCGQVSEQIAVASRLGWRLPGGSDAMKPSTAASSDA